MQKTRYRILIDSISLIIKTIISESWARRSVLLLALLSGLYFTNSLISFLLDKSVNTIFLAIIILLIMELVVRSYLIPKLTIPVMIINNIRIGSTYALILEAYKLGS